MDAPSGRRQTPEIVLSHLMEGIGIALDLDGDRMFLTDLGGTVYCAGLGGAGKQALLSVQGNLSGIAYAELSARQE
jgi:hypothetical protein